MVNMSASENTATCMHVNHATANSHPSAVHIFLQLAKCMHMHVHASEVHEHVTFIVTGTYKKNARHAPACSRLGSVRLIAGSAAASRPCPAGARCQWGRGAAYRARCRLRRGKREGREHENRDREEGCVCSAVCAMKLRGEGQKLAPKYIGGSGQ